MGKGVELQGMCVIKGNGKVARMVDQICISLKKNGCVCVHMSTGAHGGQKRASDILELELQAVVSQPV